MPVESTSPRRSNARVGPRNGDPNQPFGKSFPARGGGPDNHKGGDAGVPLSSPGFDAVATGQRHVDAPFRKITGRADDLIIRGVNVFPSEIEELILNSRSLAPHDEIEISGLHRMDEVVVRVDARAE
jgi:acyl-CoA synthetase (AMP-forming)/AMP-acid ligase II